MTVKIDTDFIERANKFLLSKTVRKDQHRQLNSNEILNMIKNKQVRELEEIDDENFKITNEILEIEGRIYAALVEIS